MRDFDDDDDDVKNDVDASGELDDNDDLDSFSSDEEEVESGVVEGISAAGQYKEILIHEEEELEKITDVLLEEGDIKKLYDKYDNLVEHVSRNNRHYQDITPMFVDGTPFLIDGCSLLTCVMQDSNYCTDNGGQTLHFIYLCERIIELICRKGGTFEVIFFRDKSVFFQDIPEYLVALSILKIHLMKNTDFAVFEMESIFSSEFRNYIAEVHPCFVIMDFSFIESFEEHLTEEKADLAKRLFHYYELSALSLGLYCVDICYVELINNTLFSYVSNANMKNLNTIINKNFIQFSKHCLDQYTPIIPMKYGVLGNGENKKMPIRKVLAVQIAKMLYEDNDSPYFIKNNELAKFFLFYCAVLECLPLTCRCFTKMKLANKNDFPLMIKKILQLIAICLHSDSIDNCDCASIADLWHGNLFFNIIWCVKDSIYSSSMGNKLDSLYKELLKHFNESTDNILEAYPIFSNIVKEKLHEISEGQNLSNYKLILPKDVQKSACSDEVGKTIYSNPLIQSLSAEVKEFCSDIMPIYNTYNISDLFKDIIKTNTDYEKKYRWYCFKSLTDDLDRIKDSNKDMAILPMKKQMILKAKYAHYMALYGSTLEGKYLEHEPIIVCDPQKELASKKKQKKQNKVTTSKKALKIREDNKMNKQKELLEVEKQKFDNFLKLFKTNKTGRLGDAKNLELVNQILLNIHSDEYTGKILYYKTEVLFQLWSDQIQRHEGDRDIDLFHLKELVLVIRSLLHFSKTNKGLLTDKQSQKLGKILCSIGFKSIAEKWNLPVDNEKSSVSPIKLSYIRFQLVHLGPDLERRVEGQIDERVTGFTPDPWQKKLFDIIDKGQSALIVAPTSSGKTHASYYCMKKVLKESNEGRVVYVAPTKALVNQVAATVCARFKNKKMPDGMSLYGFFTKEYKYYATESQILITVPECLELLLMSPRHYSWVKSLRYLIFDEIHCLAGHGGGITWERCLMLIQCPFLALSATIQNPREFWNWMQAIETFKKSQNPDIGTQVHLVVHSDRHNDLVRHIYGEDNNLHHVHPYAYLSDRVLSVHKGIPTSILPLAPRETIQLFDVMTSVSPGHPKLSELDPDNYFSCTKTGFIFRQDVKEYEHKLCGVLETWFKEERELFHKTVLKLYEPLSEHETGTKTFKYFEEKILTFVEYLRSKNMLPALIFSYNRDYCEAIVEDLATYYRKKEEEYLSSKKIPFDAAYLDDDDDEDEERSSKGKKRPVSTKKDGRQKRVTELFPLGLAKCNIEFTLRGKGRIDNKDLQFIEKRLSRKFNKDSDQVNHLRRGLGVHHGGITTVLRQSVEMLFRSKFLNVVFANETLALGIHVPCKTVVILGDSPLLNSLGYHQMSGRAGRRGFDKTGDVIFFGLDTDKVRVLMTSKLPRITGNFPLTVTTILRLLLLINDVSEKNKKTEESYNATVNRVLTVLNEGLLYQSEKKIKDQMKHFVLFSCQLLMVQRLIDNGCKPTLMAGLAANLHYYEPGNLAFMYLLRSGVLVELCSFDSEGKVRPDACNNVVKLLCRLFTKIRLMKSQISNDRKYTHSLVKLPSLPDFVNKALMKYNEEVKTIYKHYFEGYSLHIAETIGEDNKLPLSGKVFDGTYDLNELCVSDERQNPKFEMVIAGRSKRNLICSAFAGLSGQTDENLYSQTSLISNVRHQIVTDHKIIPLIDLEIPLNGYAYDFYKHGNLRTIVEENGLSSSHNYSYLFEFLLMLQSIETSLCELSMSHCGKVLNNDSDKNNLNSCVRETFSQVQVNYISSFRKAFNLDNFTI